MCWEDIKIGRRQGVAAKSMQLQAGAFVNICGSDNNRNRLIISNVANDTVYLSPTLITSTQQAIIIIGQQNPTLIMKIEDWGELLCGPWFAALGGATDFVGVIETTIRENEWKT